MANRWKPAWLLAGVIALAFLTCTVLADCPGGNCADGERCKGCPHSVAWYARCGTSMRYGGYYVGGGAPHHGEARYVDEGTWGWDYFGVLPNKRIALFWFHGAKEQGGTGAYATDGPKLKHEH